MQQFNSDLNNYPVEGIEWAMDNWGRNAKALPALADIIGMLRTWMIPGPDRTRHDPGCDQCEQGFIVMNPEAKKCDWVVTPCTCIRDASLRGRAEPKPLTMQERMELDAKLKELSAVTPKRFPNGNPRMNMPLTQAQVLRTV
jgi:hypothetical protein